VRTSFRFATTGRTPKAFVAVFILLFVNFWASYGLSAWGWVPAPDAVHSYGILYRGGVWRYYRPWVGLYLDRFFWLHFVLLAVAFLIVALQRDSFRRVEPPPPPSGPVGWGEWLWVLVGVPAVYSALGGAVMALLRREAGWTAAVGTGLIFLAISLVTVLFAGRPLLRRGPPPLGLPARLGVATLVTLLALAASMALCR
jgi:hypothetical protein